LWRLSPAMSGISNSDWALWTCWKGRVILWAFGAPLGCYLVFFVDDHM
jgi:hypothetical protein